MGEGITLLGRAALSAQGLLCWGAHSPLQEVLQSTPWGSSQLVTAFQVSKLALAFKPVLGFCLILKVYVRHMCLFYFLNTCNTRV